MLARNILCSKIIPENKDFNEDLQAEQTQISEQQPAMSMVWNKESAIQMDSRFLIILSTMGN